MADNVNKGSSTSGSADRRGRSARNAEKGSKAKKTVTNKEVNDTGDDQVTCVLCSNVFVDLNDKLMECERCSSWSCTECLGMSDVEYEVVGKRKDCHWFCKECEKPAISAVLSDKQVEEKCAAYMKSMTGRIEHLEQKINTKVDKCVVEKLDDRVKQLEGKGTAEPAEAPNQNDFVRMAIEEQREREMRKRNIIICNLQESKQQGYAARMTKDIESIEKDLSAIGVDEHKAVDMCERIGDLDPGKSRMTKVTVNSVETRRQILKNSKKLKKIAEYENVFLQPDLTKMQRTDDYNLRTELKTRKEAGEVDIFIKSGKIVKRQQRALQFRGGATEPADTEGGEGAGATPKNTE